ncbi:hypothetical protein [Carnobacterium pleistocenium]|uniref:hypothetical protein n=1 Tax=Carnobacterium pleistocenium TaxID=181073 RepID=UPI0005558B99|nr:hypothetical protein [Carnobacterium pleistocenium]
MKLFEFNKKIESQFNEFGRVKMSLNSHVNKTHLEVAFLQDESIPFSPPVPIGEHFIALIDLESCHGLKESNFDNVPEKIRTAVFDTVVEFIATPLDRRF